MNKKLCFVTMFILLATLIASSAFAQTIMPRADLYFDSATVFLSADKIVVFDCTLYDVYDRISVTSVWLERMVNGQWVNEKALTPPSYVAINMFDYGAEVDYSEDIGTGTFRVGFTVDADGYSISRYSNSRTF